MRMRLPTMNIDEDEEHVLNAAYSCHRKMRGYEEKKN